MIRRINRTFGQDQVISPNLASEAKAVPGSGDGSPPPPPSMPSADEGAAPFMPSSNGSSAPPPSASAGPPPAPDTSAPPPGAASGGAPGAPGPYDDIPFLSAWAIQWKDQKMMFAWWDAMVDWLSKHPELKKAVNDSIVTITLNGKPFASYSDLDSWVATYDKNPNEAVDKWLDAMSRALPDDIIAAEEAYVDPRWLKPVSIRTGMQGFGQFGQISTWGTGTTILVVLAILFVIGGGIFLLSNRSAKPLRKK